MIGELINGRYRIECEAGSGGMADVYKAHDLKTDRTVALKVIKKDYCMDPKYVRRFEREAQAVLSLKNANIVRAYDYGTYDSRSFIVMEFVKGCTLKEYLSAKKKLDVKTAVGIAEKILDALECAHNAGYIHRDVKPQNVLISTTGEIKLTDFGIAKDADATTKTFDGKNVVGSVHYISPEQAKGEEVGTESDIYSVGIMLFEMLVGKPPYEGENPVQVALRHINDTVPAPTEFDSAIPPAVSDVVLKATAKKREERYSSAAEMRQDLERAMAQPKKHILLKNAVRNANRNAQKTEKHGRRAKLWHVVLPVSLMVAFIVGMFVLWYVYMYGGAGNDKLSRVPDVLGETSAEAERVLENREFRIRVAGTEASADYPEGTVCRQSPVSGAAHDKNGYVDVWLSSGPPQETVLMPDLTGKKLDEASLLLSEIGMYIESVEYEPNDAEPGTIIWQSVPNGSEILPGEETIDVRISGVSGETMLPMPELSDYDSLEEIAAVLAAYGISDYCFRFAEDYRDSNVNTVAVQSSNVLAAAQNPNAGIPVLPGSVHVDVYLGEQIKKSTFAHMSTDVLADAADSTFTVVLISNIGPSENGGSRFVVYEQILGAGLHSLSFDAGFIAEGLFDCIIYMNGTEIKRMPVRFE